MSSSFDAKIMLHLHVLRNIVTMVTFAALRVNVGAVVGCKPYHAIKFPPVNIDCFCKLTKVMDVTP